MIGARLHFMMQPILIVLLIGILIPAYCRGEKGKGTTLDDLFSMSLEDLMEVDITDRVDEGQRADTFFRHWYYIKEYRAQLSSQIRKADKEKSKPLSLLVYQCDTGQQTLSYAVDLLEAGLQNFAILAVTCPGQDAVVPRDIAYDADSFNCLPIHLQKILRKHFRLNEETGLWQLRDPDFFAARIKFIQHNALEKLPDDLSDDFSPPYDVISILGGISASGGKVLDKAKEYWLEVLKDGGVLILHDGKYSAYSGWLDHAWCFNNLLSINQWVNVKDSRNSSKMLAHKKLYLEEMTQEHYELLNRAYLMMGKQKEAQKLTEDYIESKPLSFIPHVRLLGHLSTINDKERYAQVIDTLVRTNSDQMTVLGRMTYLNRDVDFINQLKRSYLDAWHAFKENPNDIDRVIDTFAFRTVTSESFDILRNILKTRLLLFIQGFYAGQNKEAELEALSDTINDTIQAIHEKEPTYLIGGKLLAAATKTRAEYFFRHDQNDKVLKYADEGIRKIQDQYYSSDYFYTLEGLGELHLLLARVYERNQAWTLVKVHAGQAQAFFDQAMLLIEEKLPEAQWRLIGNLGHSHMLQGRVHLENQTYTEADQEFQKAFDYFERALEINPQSASAVSQLRNELVKITHDHPEVSAVAPTDGWWFEEN